MSFWPSVADAMTRHLDGGGNFYTSVEVVNRWVSESRLDVMVLIEVANADIKFKEEKRGLVGRFRVEVEIESLDGQIVKRKRQLHTAPVAESEANSRTEFQVFGVLLRDVPFREGRLRCGVYDGNRRKPGLLNAARKASASSECSTDWVAEQSPRPERGVALEDPLFLAQAPMRSWDPDRQKLDSDPTGWLHDYVHPSRRYGLQEDHLQIFQPVWPALGGIPLDYEPLGLRVEVINMDMDFALRDTIEFGERGRLALAAGRPAALFYQLDVNLLPEGAYLLSLAPLDGQGRGSLTQFDVVWRLAALGRHRNLVLGEGRTLFSGAELARFLDSSAAEQEKILDDFWAGLNPDPESPVNAVYLEFQYRIAYVQQFLDGFDAHGAYDERGEVFIALGPPDAYHTRRMPRNSDEQDFARANVYDRYALVDGAALGSLGSVSGAQNINSYGAVEGVSRPLSHGAERDRTSKFFSAQHNFPFEYWEYDMGGDPLFPSQYSQKGMGQRFLFIDQTGTGEYALDSSNVIQADE